MSDKPEPQSLEAIAAELRKYAAGGPIGLSDLYRLADFVSSHAQKQSEEIVYLLIEHGDGNDPARIHVCKTELERHEKTALAIYGDQVTADLHAEQLASDLHTLTQDLRLEFEGDPPLQWVDGVLALRSESKGGQG